jgi:hypothetical protein
MRLGALILGLALAPVALGQEVVLIDFEDIATRGWGEGGQVVLTDQYANRGVTFNSPRVFDYTQGIPIPDFVHGTRAIQHCFAAEFCVTPIVATFSRPMARVRVWVGFARENVTTDITFTARDAAGAMIAQLTLTVPESAGPTPVSPLEIRDPNRGIVSVEVVPAGNFGINDVVVDDLEFDDGVVPPPPPEPFDLAIGDPSIAAKPDEGAIITVPITVSGATAGATTLVAAAEGWEGPITTNVAALEPGQHSVAVVLPATLADGRYEVQLTLQTPPGQQESTPANNTVAVQVVIDSNIIRVPVPVPGPFDSIPKVPILIGLAVLLAIATLVKVLRRAPQPPAAMPQIAFNPRLDPGTQSFVGGDDVRGRLEISLRPQPGEQDSSVKEQP